MSNSKYTTDYLFGSDSNDSDSTYDLIISAKITVARNAAKKMVTRSNKKDTSKISSMANRYNISVRTEKYSTIKERGNEMKIVQSGVTRYNLRSKTIEKSMTNNAISKRSKKKVRVDYGIITKHRWTIRRNMWSKTKLDTVRKFLDKLNKKNLPQDYALRGDLNRMMLPQSLLSKSFIRSSQEMTKSLKLNMQIGDTHALISRQGSKRQYFH